MSKFSKLVVRLLSVWVVFSASGCGGGKLASCDNAGVFGNLDEASKVECLTSRVQDDLAGHAAFGLAQIYLLKYASSATSTVDEENFTKYSVVARSAEYANEGIKREVLTMLDYFDALMSMRSGRTVGRGDSWLDSVCPAVSQSARFDCHAKRLEYWFQQAEDGSQSENEALYLAYRALHEKYREPIYKGVEISAMGFFDLPGARAEFEQLKAADRLEPPVIFGFCDMLARRRESDSGEAAAIAESSCR